MRSPGVVGTVVASFSCDGAGFAKVPVFSEGRQYDTTNSLLELRLLWIDSSKTEPSRPSDCMWSPMIASSCGEGVIA